MLLDAIVLAGGRSSRLSGTPKSALLFGGASLLQRTVGAASIARRIVVVGEAAMLELAGPLPDAVLVTREDPPFGGPAAGIGAGMAALAGSSDFTLVLACDMPEVGAAVRELLAAVRPGSDGAVAIDARQHPQHLVAVYNTARLADALTGRSLDGLSVRALASSLRLDPVDAPPGSTDDVDTWADAERFGIQAPAGTRAEETA